MYRKHFLLSQKQQGIVKELRGKVLCRVIFVSDPENQWTEAEKQAFTAKVRKVTELTRSEAQKMGVPLQFTLQSDAFQSKSSIGYADSATNIDYLYAREKGCSMSGIYVARLKNSCAVDEVALLFVQKPQVMPRAQLAITGEFCVLSQDNDVRTILHEMLHLFGAADLYTPEYVLRAASCYFPYSVMLGIDTQIDPFTMYLIGWTEQPSAEAKAFLDETGRI